MNCKEFKKTNNRRYKPTYGLGCRFVLLAILTLMLLTTVAAPAIGSKKKVAYQKHEIQVAFVYKLLSFVDWPNEKGSAEQNSSAKPKPLPIRMGIFGRELHENVERVIAGKTVNGRKIEVRLLTKTDIAPKNGRTGEALHQCQVVFVCGAAGVDVTDLFAAIKGAGILTIGSENDFLEKGGILNFVYKNKKMGFEINMIAADRAGLKIRSKLLRLAKRVIKKRITSEKGD